LREKLSKATRFTQSVSREAFGNF